MLIIPFLGNAQAKVEVNGYAPYLKSGTEVTLRRIDPSLKKNLLKPLELKTSLENGKFNFFFENAGAEMYLLTVKKRSETLYLPSGVTNLSIKDSLLRKISIENTTASEYANYDEDKKRVSLKSKYLWLRADYDDYIRGEKVDSQIAVEKSAALDSANLAQQNYSANQSVAWIKSNPNSLINSKILYDQLTTLSDDTIKYLFDLIPTMAKQNSYGKLLLYNIENLLSGATPPPFHVKTPQGKIISLSDFRGKYVLLDFWASWCIPCRKVNPSLVKIYKKFGKRNFSIIGISLDHEKEKWEKAIAADGLNWTHVSELKGMNGKISKDYDVGFIPNNYLLGPRGKVVARNIDPVQLQLFLEKFSN